VAAYRAAAGTDPRSCCPEVRPALLAINGAACRVPAPERDTEAGILSTAGVHVDVTRRREAEEQLGHLAVHDELTGLLNRRGILRSIERVHSQAQRTGRPYCLAILDLDHFKQVNDAYGHAAGDRVHREADRG